MGGGNSCPECPKCEEKTCPSNTTSSTCPECPKCDNSWSVVDNIKRIPVSGTPFTVLKMDILDVKSFDDVEQAIGPLIDLSTLLMFAISPDQDYNKINRVTIIALQVPYKPKKGYVYGEQAAYEKLKKASKTLNNVLKEYPDWYIFSVDQTFNNTYSSSIINGGELAERYDKYQPLFTKEEIPNIRTLMSSNTTVNDEVIFGLKGVISVNDLNLKIVALMWPDFDIPSEDLLFMPEQRTENFCASSDNYCCLITTIIILILIGIGLYILFCRSDKSVQWANIAENHTNINTMI